MRVKKIIPLFVFFAMVISLLSVPAHATYGGGIGRADLWEWTYGLYQSGNTDFNPGGIYGGGGGRDDLSAAYSSYVSDLELDYGTFSFSSTGALALPLYHHMAWFRTSSYQKCPHSDGASLSGYEYVCSTSSDYVAISHN